MSRAVVMAWLAGACGVAAAAMASPDSPPVAGEKVLITLATGETLRGTLVRADDAVVFEHPVLGTLTLAKDKVTSVRKEEPPAPASPATEAAAPPPPQPAPPPQRPPQPAPAPAAAPAPAPEEPSFFEKWTGTLEGGMNGADGNSNSASFRVNLGGRRETPEMFTTLGVGWWYARANNRETQDRTTYEIRNEWPLQSGSSWRWFVASTGEFDAFKNFDYRLTGSSGLVWNFYTTDTFTATMRLGLGGTREFGPAAADPTADAFPGLDLSFKVTEHSKLTASYDGVFSLDQTDQNRSIMRVAYDILIDPKNKIGLKLGIEDRYEATPTLGRERHDLEYFALLTIAF